MIKEIIPHIDPVKKLYHQRYEIYELNSQSLYHYTYVKDKNYNITYEFLYRNTNFSFSIDKPYLFPFKKTSKTAKDFFAFKEILKCEYLYFKDFPLSEFIDKLSIIKNIIYHPEFNSFSFDTIIIYPSELSLIELYFKNYKRSYHKNAILMIYRASPIFYHKSDAIILDSFIFKYFLDLNFKYIFHGVYKPYNYIVFGYFSYIDFNLPDELLIIRTKKPVVQKLMPFNSFIFDRSPKERYFPDEKHRNKSNGKNL